MRYGYDIRFSGVVEDTRDSGQLNETIEDIREVVINSFNQDLQAGVNVDATTITVYVLPEKK